MRKLCLKILGVMIIMTLLLQTNLTVVIAVDETTELKDEKNQNNKQINEAKNDLQDVQKEKSETVKQVEQLSSQILDYESQIGVLDRSEEHTSELQSQR